MTMISYVIGLRYRSGVILFALVALRALGPQALAAQHQPSRAVRRVVDSINRIVRADTPPSTDIVPSLSVDSAGRLAIRHAWNGEFPVVSSMMLARDAASVSSRPSRVGETAEWNLEWTCPVTVKGPMSDAEYYNLVDSLSHLGLSPDSINQITRAERASRADAPIHADCVTIVAPDGRIVRRWPEMGFTVFLDSRRNSLLLHLMMRLVDEARRDSEQSR